MESIFFTFVRLDKFFVLFQLADKKRQETKQTYCIDKQKINTTEINDDCMTTKRPAGNTSLSDNSRIRAIWSCIARITFIVVYNIPYKLYRMLSKEKKLIFAL